MCMMHYMHHYMKCYMNTVGHFREFNVIGPVHDVK
jgi:hypothetical protein